MPTNDTQRRRAARGARLREVLNGAGRSGGFDKLPTVRELAEDALAEFGGSRRFFRAIRSEWREAKAGSQIRQRLADMLLRIVVAGARLEEGNVGDDADLADEDIERQMTALVEAIEADSGDDSEVDDAAPEATGGETADEADDSADR